MNKVNALVTLENSSSAEVQLISEDTYLLNPQSLAFYTPVPIYVTCRDDIILISEDQISPKSLLEDVFDEDGNTNHARIYSFDSDEMENLLNEDPLLLADFYQLITTHDAFEKELLDLINLLGSRDFSLVAVIHRLMAASTSEVEKILHAEEPISAYLNLME